MTRTSAQKKKTERQAIQIVSAGVEKGVIVYYIEFKNDRKLYAVTSAELKRKYPAEFLTFLESICVFDE